MIRCSNMREENGSVDCRATIGVTADIPLGKYVESASEDICSGGWRNFPLETSEQAWGFHLIGQVRHIKSTAFTVVSGLPNLANDLSGTGVKIGIRYVVAVGLLSFYVNGKKVHTLKNIPPNLKLHPAVHLCHNQWIIVADFNSKAPE